MFTPIIFLTEVMNILQLKWCVISLMIKIKKSVAYQNFFKKSIENVLDDTVNIYLIRIFEINGEHFIIVNKESCFLP